MQLLPGFEQYFESFESSQEESKEKHIKAHKRKIRKYLEDVLRRMMSHPYSRLNELLPDEWAQRKKQATS